MILTKIIETSVDLFDGTSIYNANYENLLKNMLSANLKGCCIAGCLVLEIDNILRRSTIRMSNRLDGAASVDVEFQVKCMVINVGEIICCKILESRPNGMTAINDHVNAIVQINSEFGAHKALQVGDLVPLQVTAVGYSVGRNRITAITNIYMPTPHTNIYYNLLGGLSETEKLKVAELIVQITKLKSQIATCSPVVANLFYEFVYPFKTKRNFADVAPTKMTNITMQKALELENGVIVLPAEQLCNQEGAFYAANSPASELKECQVVDSSAAAALFDICNTHISRLQVVLTLCENYPTVSGISSIRNYWKICNNNKL